MRSSQTGLDVNHRSPGLRNCRNLGERHRGKIKREPRERTKGCFTSKRYQIIVSVVPNKLIIYATKSYIITITVRIWNWSTSRYEVNRVTTGA